MAINNDISEILSRVNNFKSEVDKAIDAYEEAKKKLKTEKESLAKSIKDVFLDTKISQLPSIANEIYWSNEMLAGIVKDAYKEVSGHGFMALASPSGVFCKICNREILVTSWASKNREIEFYQLYLLDPSRRGPLCSQCERDEAKRYTEQYQQRQELISERETKLNTMPYREYLQTPEWNEKRKYMLRQARYACQLCNNGGELHVHHRTYERRGYEANGDLIVLCKDCHQKFHDIEVNNG